MPKPDKPVKPPKPPKPRALPSYTVYDLPLAAGKDGELVAIKNDTGVLLSLAISDGLTWLTVPVTEELVLPARPDDTL